MVDSRGRLLEGLVTNVFVVVEREGEKEEEEQKEQKEQIKDNNASLPPPLSRFELQTASPEEGVLDGVMRRAVLEAAGSLGLGVALSAPDPKLLFLSQQEQQQGQEQQGKRRRRWREAFVTSALRGVAPLREIRGEEIGEEKSEWRVEFDEAGGVPGPVTRAIAEALPAVVGHHRVQL